MQRERKKGFRISAWLLTLIMLVSLIPTTALASMIVANGTCGAEGDGHNLTWTLDSEGVLTISGEGTMKDYPNAIDDYEGIITTAPWGGHIKQLKSVVINSGVTSIGDNAFYGCNGLTSVTIPNSVTSIGSSVFCGCSNLTDVYYNSTDIAWHCISIDYGNDALDNADIHYAEPTGRIVVSGTCGAEGDGSNLTWTLDDKGTLTISGEGAMKDYSASNSPWYKYCSAIKTVTIGNSVTSIGDWAFSNCSSLTSVTIGNSVTRIGEYAFSDCTELTEINYNAKAAADLAHGSYVFYNAGTSGEGISVIFGDSVEKIPAYLFYAHESSDNPKVTSVTIPDSVTSIGKYAFKSTPWLASQGDFAVANGILIAYQGKGNAVTTPDSVTRIGEYAFSDCSSLTSVTIGNSVTSIDNDAFYGCSGLTSVTIPEGVMSIGSGAFYNCSSLTSVRYNAKAATAGSDVFYNAGWNGSGIKVFFGDKVKKIPQNLFYSYSTPKIVEITFAGNAPAIGNDAFYDITANAYYPTGNATWTEDVRQYRCGSGYITWVPYSTAEIVSIKCTIQKDIYVVGDTLDTSGITVTINRADGCVETYDYATGEIKLSAYDMSKPGTQSITVTCKGASTELNISVHDKQVKTMDAKDYPESSHNYENNLDKTYTYKVLNGLSMEVTFSEKTAVETNVDYIYVNGTQYTGTALAGKTISIDGDTLTIRLVSDGSDTEYGFSIDSIVATTFVHNYTVSKVVAPTCTEQGYTIYTCKICGDTYRADQTKATGHHYTENVVKPTCTSVGYTLHTCKDCGDSYKTDYVEAYGHDYASKVIKAATCKAEGVMSYTCVNCGDSYTEAIGRTSHKVVVDKSIEATCTEKGLTEGSHCSVCNAIITAQQEIDALGHDYGAWISINDKQHQRVCANDATHVEVENHHFVDGKCDACGYLVVLLGDVNNDGKVNQKDVARLRQFLADNAAYPMDAPQNADVNKDGKINQKDVARLRQYLADNKTYPLG